MRLLDSNIVIHAVQPSNAWLRKEILEEPFAVSHTTRVEVLGWHLITAEDLSDLTTFIAAGTLLSITDNVADRAVILRQQRKMSLGDALIAATALEYGCDLVTRNTQDFRHISGLPLVNPFDRSPGG